MFKHLSQARLIELRMVFLGLIFISPATVQAIQPDDRQINLDELVAGRFSSASEVSSDNKFMEPYYFEAKQGQRFQVAMSSTTVDPHLKIASPNGDVMITDDDGGKKKNAELWFTAPSAGHYSVVATQAERKQGTYSLQIKEVNPRQYSTDGDPSGKYALVVGLADYPNSPVPLEDTPISIWVQDLKFVENDVSSVRLKLSELGFAEDNVQLLENEQATYENILNGIRQHLGQAGPDGLAFFYFSGHGTRLTGNFGVQDDEEDNRDDALVVHDALIIDDELNLFLGNLSAGRLIAVFDACNSGSISRAPQYGIPKAVSFEGISRFFQISKLLGDGTSPETDTASSTRLDVKSESEQVKIFLYAAEEDQQAIIWPPIKQSIFTHFFVENLTSQNSRTLRQFSEIIAAQTTEYMINEVCEWPMGKKANCKGYQVPLLDPVLTKGEDLLVSHFFQ